MRGFYQQLVSPTEFIESTHYVGAYAGFTNEVWSSTFDLMFDGGSNGRDFVVIDGAIAPGKPPMMNLAILRPHYELQAVFEPQRAYGLLPDATIHIPVVSSVPGVIDRLEDAMTESTFFKDVGWTSMKDRICFANGVEVVQVDAEDRNFFGMNAFSAFFDDANHLKSENVGLLIASVYRRIQGGFATGRRIPGMLFVAGSAGGSNVTEQLRALNPSLVRRFSIWAARPKAFQGTRRFRVAVDRRRGEYTLLGPWDDAPDGASVVEVPEDYRADFERDIEGCLRDIAGIPI